MNENDQFADAALIRAVELQSVATWLLSDWLYRLDDLQKEIIGLIASNDPTDSKSDAELNALLALVRAKIQEVFDTLANDMGEAFDEIGDIQADEDRKNFLAIFGITLAAFAAVRSVDLEIVGLKVSEWLKRTAGDLELRTVSAIRRGVASNESLADLITRVKGSSGLTGEISTPLVAPTKISVEALTRTAVEAVANQTQQVAGESIAPPIAEVFSPEPKTIRYAWRQKSIIDFRTSKICLERANKLWSSDFKPINHTLPFAVPPLHPHCRSQLVLELLDSDPSTDETFAEWMDRQTDAAKRKIFGSKAYDLWLEKKISDSDLLRSRERQLTFDELRKRNES